MITTQDDTFFIAKGLAQVWFDDLKVGDEYLGISPVAEDLFDTEEEQKLFTFFALGLVNNADICVDDDNIIVSMRVS